MSAVAKVFDPLGFTLPVTVKAKLLLNRLWKANYGWDDPLNEFSNEWNKIKEDLVKLSTVEISRQAYNDTVSLVIFVTVLSPCMALVAMPNLI